MTVTTLVLAGIAAFLVAVIGALMCLGIVIGVMLASGVAFFYRKFQKPPQAPIQPYAMPRHLVDAQRQVIEKTKSLYGGKLSSRQQEIMNEEVEKALLGKVGEVGWRG